MISRAALALLGVAPFTGCGSSADLSTELTIVATLMDGQGGPVGGARGQLCVVARYRAAYVGGEAFDNTSCVSMTPDTSGHVTTMIVLGPRLQSVESSYVLISGDSCHYAGVVPPLQIRDEDSHRAASAEMTYVISSTTCA